ncbi:MAG: aspartyl-phosphate phosphatase Spo0E family protein [Peptococcaceae bacterium]|nr:aspartyl-phosphate phosphatase Spo0E family protein [Peptococcaceae bacterium]
MNRLAGAGADYARVLEVSQRLDELIVLFYKTAA